jgi:hypothetical protein
MIAYLGYNYFKGILKISRRSRKVPAFAGLFPRHLLVGRGEQVKEVSYYWLFFLNVEKSILFCRLSKTFI